MHLFQVGKRDSERRLVVVVVPVSGDLPRVVVGALVLPYSWCREPVLVTNGWGWLLCLSINVAEARGSCVWTAATARPCSSLLVCRSEICKRSFAFRLLVSYITHLNSNFTFLLITWEGFLPASTITRSCALSSAGKAALLQSDEFWGLWIRPPPSCNPLGACAVGEHIPEQDHKSWCNYLHNVCQLCAAAWAVPGWSTCSASFEGLLLKGSRAALGSPVPHFLAFTKRGVPKTGAMKMVLPFLCLCCAEAAFPPSFCVF